MDSYHSSFNGSHNPYYPPPPPPNAYPPGYGSLLPYDPPQHYSFPHSDPQFPYAGPSFHHQQPSFHSNHPPMPPPAFGYQPHLGSFEHQGSLQYSGPSFNHQHYQSSQFLHQETSTSSSLTSSCNQQCSEASAPWTPSSSKLYPIEDVFALVRLSEGHSPSGLLSTSSSFIGIHRQDSGSVRHGDCDSFSHSSSFDSSRHELVPYSPTKASRHELVPYSPTKASLKVVLLHGSLDIWIYEAKNLPNRDRLSKALSDMFRMKGCSKIADKIDRHMPTQHTITSDPYVSVTLSNAVVARTYVIPNDENPVWNQHSDVPVAHHAAEVVFTVKDNDYFGYDLIGTVSIPAEQIFSGEKVNGVFPILDTNKKQCKEGATLKISIQYIPIEKKTLYSRGVGGSDHKGIPGTYFPLRKGGKITLYQDAHVPDDHLPAMRLDKDMYYRHGKCWRDIYDAMKQAQRLIYITGWSVYHMVTLVRDCESHSDTLGEILRAKSQQGVRVLLLVWDDPTSRRILGFQTDGLMQTHDEDTKKFFKHSSVRVLLCPRSAGKRHSLVKKRETGVIYTHHQKSVILDTDALNGKRKIIAFIGGLDLCDGRYDTPTHSLFRTLHTTHREDYHNPTFPAGVTSPREPWHDLHCKIDGLAAYDVLTNFEERWKKASKPHVKKLKWSEDDSLLKLESVPDIIFDAPSLDEGDTEAWHAQIFRSIDSNSVKGFPKDPKKAMSKNLTCGKNVTIDMSIHTAYVEAIRAAQHFIYIENQYFIGSSYNWSSHNDAGADNLIPMEIALKIANKIKANERFSAYIVIPMWPEGVPTAITTQQILYWQNKTMKMMYETIYKALEESGLERRYHPRDYLTFFCLGNREVDDGNDTVSPSRPPAPANSPQSLAQRYRRFMIYVHSKGMIVDDEYVILGSANINQRSMDGTRDSEIAMGAYQPQHTWARKFSHPRGQIYGYRMSLWAEHLGVLEECFRHPENLECIRRVNQLAESNWRQFAAEEVTEMRGHLLRYPIEVDARGKVKHLPGCETFPDCGGNIHGKFALVQENLTL